MARFSSSAQTRDTSSVRAKQMARIAGVNIPDNKRIEIGLTYIFGIGQSTSQQILKDTGIDPGIQGKDLTEDETIKLRDAVENHEVGGDLRADGRRTHKPRT